MADVVLLEEQGQARGLLGIAVCRPRESGDSRYGGCRIRRGIGTALTEADVLLPGQRRPGVFRHPPVTRRPCGANPADDAATGLRASNSGAAGVVDVHLTTGIQAREPSADVSHVLAVVCDDDSAVAKALQLLLQLVVGSPDRLNPHQFEVGGRAPGHGSVPWTTRLRELLNETVSRAAHHEHLLHGQGCPVPLWRVRVEPGDARLLAQHEGSELEGGAVRANSEVLLEHLEASPTAPGELVENGHCQGGFAYEGKVSRT